MTGYPSGIIGAMIGLLLFGIIYAAIVNHLSSRADGYTWLLVVIGVLVTVLTAGLFIGSQNVIITLILFACSGAPMAAENIYSGVSKRIRMERAANDLLTRLADRGIGIASEVNNDDTTEAAG